MSQFVRHLRPLAFAASLILSAPSAQAWGEVGHKTVGLIAGLRLDPAVSTKVAAILATDATPYEAKNIGDEANWADTFKYANDANYAATNLWHFVDIEVVEPGKGDIDKPCNHFPVIPTGQPAYPGIANDCVIDKINEFAVELHDPATPPLERLLALQFLLHLVGDEHQPLHSSDRNDRGGNKDPINTADGINLPAKPTDQVLHHLWDTEFVEQLVGTNAETNAMNLNRSITAEQCKAWLKGTQSDWAKAWAVDTYGVSASNAYGNLPAPTNGRYDLPKSYIDTARTVVPEQLQKGGVRLAAMLTWSLSDLDPLSICKGASFKKPRHRSNSHRQQHSTGSTLSHS